MEKFVHLHLHTEYSLLDGAIRLKDLFPRAKELGYDTLAITDHGNMYGALHFYQQALRHDIKPILGCECYVAPKGRKDRSAKSAGEAAYHLVLLAENATGYRNLLRLVTAAHFEGFYYKPRIDLDLLRDWNEGLIALSACLHGQIPAALLHGDRKGARALAETYARIFPGRFYIELQENGIPEQAVINRELAELARELGLPLVATNDCHYLTAEAARAHDVLLCIQTNRTVDDPNRMRFTTDRIYFTSPEEMAERFRDYPEALAATAEIAERCNVELELGRHRFPVYPLAEGETYEAKFEAMARAGLEERLAELGIEGEAQAPYRERLEEEIAVIKEKGFPSYFLIVADFINWAKSKGIPVGPGRGSAAGSLVAYSMRITDIDPVRYGLFFERFLNVERASLPDIDVDFCMRRRDEVLRYVAEKYGGEDFVAQIITFGQMKARAVIRDVGRAMGLAYPEVDRIAKLVPEQLGVTLERALQMEPRLAKLAEDDPKVAELLTVARALEGLPRHSSTHAAGVVISDRPMHEYLPLTKGQAGETVTQFDMKCVEKTGLIKFDFLGLKTLTVIDVALRLIRDHYGEEIDIGRIPLDDPATYELLSSGDTTGVFQLESSGMKDLLRRMRPSSFTDMIALVALYRPGPLESGMVDQFVKAKHGEMEVTYLLPELEPILQETYGVIVYQEQVMKIAQVLAGYSLGEGDLLRRAMGKKIPAEMAAQRDRFLTGARERGIPEDKARTIFDLMEKFAGYGFNKSHSAAYALIAYQTAWLKTHYLLPFLASLLTNELGNTDGVVKFIGEAKAQGVRVLPPDINRSDLDFTIEDDAIRFGLTAVKNVGAGAIEAILEARREGPFASFEDFCCRVDLRKVNKRVIESLIKCGAFDALGHRRSQLMEALDQALELGQSRQAERLSGQMSLFDAMAAGAAAPEPARLLILPDVPEWPDLERLRAEKEALGFYISGHPLDPYAADLDRLTTAHTENVAKLPDGTPVSLAGVIRSRKEITTKKGDRMAFIVLEDLRGSIEVVCFPEVYVRAAELLEGDRPVWVQGTYKKEDDRGVHKVLAETVEALEEARRRRISGLTLELRGDRLAPEDLEPLRQVLRRHPGPYPVRLGVVLPGEGRVLVALPDDLNVRLSPELTEDIEAVIGYPGLRIEYEPLAPADPEAETRAPRRAAR
ncbi:DNA polymerase III subunit alpha [Dissulfurirhabdus thermomarina]|uniref:DNA polymerase III subunit alpha n=1 Tax=Dissulfurirhabdus thermomarina TaxID=1765737 RepID=A0A6N9TLA1_DISTH|nr:DNA polymerase III subunit alpha [Dissulfurirhabdus thermomarina]NDY41899.1 DNA polymerase III subunit alpha [Dissulfurirhabdus thermomarina]NMX23715.1 DNA polymerase III subunit alpha [Dissulfurirhabdus thermomarina]